VCAVSAQGQLDAGYRGRLHTRFWEHADSQRYEWTVITNEVLFLDQCEQDPTAALPEEDLLDAEHTRGRMA